MTEVDNLMQLLTKSDRAFNYCYQYFIDDVWKMRMDAHETGNREKDMLAAAMASWIPWEPCADKLIARVCELAGE